ncbi:MAG: hypothetical protein JJ992_27490, partial [Planctomycetes bacterium]|nr:hypothetical protein [Planctomycetota bacterium]
LMTCVVVAILPVRPVAAYTPESEEVQTMLNKAVKYLEDAPPFSYGDGGYFLAAMAIIKSGRDEDHPIVKLAIDKALKKVEEVRKRGVGGTCYNEAILCYFLCDLNPKLYYQEIKVVLDAMVKRQRPNGCWGYYPHTYDDTSQSQYGVLCLWAAHQHGIPVSAQSVESAAQWMMRVQDPSGGWCYRATDPGSFQRR